MNITLTRIMPGLLAGLLTLLLAACSAQPRTVNSLEEARALVAEVNRDPMADKVAGAELEQAKQALAKADEAVGERDSMVSVQHLAYVATRHAEIARERIAEARARKQIEESKAERNEVLLMARTTEAERAKALADARSAEAAYAMAVADANARDAAEAKALAEARSAELARQERETAQAREQADAALAAAREMQNELQDLKAEQTARGLVMTLSGGVLFDVDKATLKPGAEITLDRLAAFMNDYPERNLMIEGHTDSTGNDAYNMTLSTERANAVRNALVARGVAETRIRASGLGENYPVATNDSNAGRQLNRRVEIVLSDPDGRFPEEANRTVSIR